MPRYTPKKAPSDSSPAMAATAIHCCFSDRSSKFGIALRPLALLLFAGQRKNKRLHVFDLRFLKRFFHFYGTKVARLLQVGDQVRDRVPTQRHALDVDVVTFILD